MRIPASEPSLAWETELPRAPRCPPEIAGDRVLVGDLSIGSAAQRAATCLDLRDGSERWRSEVRSGDRRNRAGPPRSRPDGRTWIALGGGGVVVRELSADGRAISETIVPASGGDSVRPFVLPLEDGFVVAFEDRHGWIHCRMRNGEPTPSWRMRGLPFGVHEGVLVTRGPPFGTSTVPELSARPLEGLQSLWTRLAERQEILSVGPDVLVVDRESPESGVERLRSFSLDTGDERWSEAMEGHVVSAGRSEHAVAAVAARRDGSAELRILRADGAPLATVRMPDAVTFLDAGDAMRSVLSGADAPRRTRTRATGPMDPPASAPRIVAIDHTRLLWADESSLVCTILANPKEEAWRIRLPDPARAFRWPPQGYDATFGAAIAVGEDRIVIAGWSRVWCFAT